MVKNQTPVENMALYSDLLRVQKVLSKEGWCLKDTETFAHMHYLGTEALDNAAKKLGLTAGQIVLDLGSGFGGTGRYLNSKYRCDVTGVELQKVIAEIAETVNRKYNEQYGRQVVKTIIGDFLEVVLDQQFDHAISLLTILHVSLSQREKLFQRLNQCLKPGGKVYIEDFYQKNNLTEKERNDLDRIISCPGLPTREEYTATLEKVGFDVEFEDVTGVWTDFVVTRADAYSKTESPSPNLLLFYQTMSDLFQWNNLGGVRITATKTK